MTAEAPRAATGGPGGAATGGPGGATPGADGDGDAPPDPGPRARSRRWIVLVPVAALAVAVAFLAGTAWGAGAGGPAPTDRSAEAGFARDMQVHHAQAVEMAMDLYPRTDDRELRAVAYDIATGQSAQRGQMYQWLVDWGLSQASAEPAMAWMREAGPEHGGHAAGAGGAPGDVAEAMGMATPAQLDALRAARGAEADCRFLALMIRHHEGAIPMVAAVTELGREPGVLQTARSMAETQGAEIEAMRSIRERLGCAAG